MTVRLLFDRGTLVLEGLPREAGDLAGIPGARWDIRVGAYRAPAGTSHALAAELRRRCVPLAGSPLPKLVPLAGSRPAELRPHQRAALFAWRLAGGRGVLSLPGAGDRTAVALAAIGATRTPTLCLAPTGALLETWRTRLRQHGHLATGIEGQRTFGPVTLATFASAHRQLCRVGDQFGLLLVDEIHHFGRGFPDEVLEMTTAPLRLGLSGGAPLPDPVRNRIDALMGPVLFALSSAEEAGDYLAPFHRIAWHLDRARPQARQRALSALLDCHRREKTAVLVPDERGARAVARTHPTVTAQLLSRAGKMPAVDVGILVGAPAGDPERARWVGGLLRPSAGQRALVYQLMTGETDIGQGTSSPAMAGRAISA